MTCYGNILCIYITYIWESKDHCKGAQRNVFFFSKCLHASVTSLHAYASLLLNTFTLRKKPHCDLSSLAEDVCEKPGK